MSSPMPRRPPPSRPSSLCRNIAGPSSGVFSRASPPWVWATTNIVPGIATCSMSSSPIFYHDRPAETRRKKRSLLFPGTTPHGRRALCPGARPGRGDYPRPLSHPTQQDRGVFPQKENLYHSERISVLLEPPVDLIFSSPNCPFSIPRLPRSEVGRHPRCVLFAPSLSCFRQNSLQESLKTRVTSRSGPFFPHTPSFCLRYEPIDSRSGRIPSNDGR